MSSSFCVMLQVIPGLKIAAKIYPDSSSGNLSDLEWEMAQNIFHIMVKDAEVRVCEALSLIFKENPNLPHDLLNIHASDFNTGFLPADILKERYKFE